MTKYSVIHAVKHFWKTRTKQSSVQGKSTGIRDQGERSAVTGGRQMDGFTQIVCERLVQAGCPKTAICCDSRLELPGFFRPEKRWDLVVICDGNLLACVEFKSQIGPSFGNNFNNRTEEAIGNATDMWTAYREGAFPLLQRPWLGYLFLLEDCKKSQSPVRIKEPHFSVFPEFAKSSYCKRYELFLAKLVRERLYNSTCFLTSDQQTGSRGKYKEPVSDLAFECFVRSLTDHIKICAARKNPPPLA